MLRRLFTVLLMSLLVIPLIGGHRIYRENRSQSIGLRPLALVEGEPKRRRVGSLIFLKAWELRSDNSDFGGISALMALPNNRFVGVSDAGALVGFGLTRDSQTDRPFIAAMPGAFGSKVGYLDRDSESITRDPASGQFWVGYEGRHAIRRFPASFSRVDAVVYPKQMRKWQANRGAEALVRLRNGRFIAFSESSGPRDAEFSALAFSGDPIEPGTTATPFFYHPPSGYYATDVAELPDGRLLLLNRRISFPKGFTAKLTLVDPADIHRDAVVRGRVIATLAPPLLVDNMEGISITQEEGRTIVWMISDNNFLIFQRTLLMKFALDLRMKKPEADKATPGFESLE